MDELLTVSSTRRLTKNEGKPVPDDRPAARELKPANDLKSAEGIREALRSQPSLEILAKCLQWLAHTSSRASEFNIKVPSAQAAPIVFLLANDILANFWPVLKESPVVEDSNPRANFLICLRSLAGIGILTTRLGILTQALKDGVKTKPTLDKRSSESVHASETIDFLQALLEEDRFIYNVWQDVEQLIAKPIQRELAWKELVTWLSSGRLVTIAAEASAVNTPAPLVEKEGQWVADGSRYVKWLGRNIMTTALKLGSKDPAQTKKLAELLKKSLSLGYSDDLVATLLSICIEEGTEPIFRFKDLFDALPAHTKGSVVFSTLQFSAKRFTHVPKEQLTAGVGAAAYLMRTIFFENFEGVDALQEWLLGTGGGGVGLDIKIHKAAVAVLASKGSAVLREAAQPLPDKPNVLTETLQRVLKQFGDELFIKHSPVLNQEVCAQDLLLLFGQVYQDSKESAVTIARSSLYINTISHRIAASSRRAQLLGMIVGTVISDLLDASDSKMKFDLDELESSERNFYFGLSRETLDMGTLEDLKSLREVRTMAQAPKPRAMLVRQKKPMKALEEPKPSAIQVIDDENEEDDLPTYAKPDADHEDEDEDPTVIRRKKATAPVYIRDLLVGLRETEDCDRTRLALSSASDLIRRKTNFGTEVSDHIEDLATQLVGMKDSFDMTDFQEMRLRGMIAVVVARPVGMGQWFSNTLFHGDYSMSQRASILTALSLAARELAGYREDDAKLTGAIVPNEELFPSQKLPEKYAKLYSSDMLPVDQLSKQLERSIIRPIALEAADKVTGPDILKVRTFSSRMEVEKKRKRPIKNELAKVVADGFFYPLTGRFNAHIQAQNEHSVFATPFLQAHLLKTLALILNASGPSTLSLVGLTTEFWALLLFMRKAAVQAAPVMEALLFAFLTLLEINNNDPKRIAEDHGPELVETQAWVEGVMGNLGGGSEEGDKARALAAAVLVRTHEVVDKYKRLLTESLMDYI